MESKVSIIAYKSPKFNKKEAMRYAGILSSDLESEEQITKLFNELTDKLSYKLCYRRYSVSVSGDTVDLGFTTVNSHSLAICLSQCHEILLFCATISAEIDRKIAKSIITSPAKAVLVSAIGSERIESLCDEFCRDLATAEAEKGNIIRPRFSPGYGDLPLALQKDIFSALDPQKNIGVYLGDNLFMSPSKSVSAIIGIKKVNSDENT